MHMTSSVSVLTKHIPAAEHIHTYSERHISVVGVFSTPSSQQQRIYCACFSVSFSAAAAAIYCPAALGWLHSRLSSRLCWQQTLSCETSRRPNLLSCPATHTFPTSDGPKRWCAHTISQSLPPPPPAPMRAFIRDVDRVSPHI